MIVKHQKEETVTRLKKAYSSVAQATNKAIYDYGPVKTWEVGQNGSGTDADKFAKKYLIPYLNVSKNCGTNNSEECYWEAHAHNTPNVELSFGSDRSRFYLLDGVRIGVLLRTPGRVILYIDINGQKGPNRFGRDLFEYHYFLNIRDDLNGKLLPAYNELSRENQVNSGTFSSCSTGGYGCADLIMKDGWKIADDYPW